MGKIIVFCFFVLFSLNTEALMVSQLSHLGKLNPGEQEQGKVTLINDKDKPENIDIKLYDYSCNPDGEHFFQDTGTHLRSNASWITLNTNRVTLSPGENADVYFTINVPNDQTIKGSYWTVMMIEPADPISTMAPNDEGMALDVKIRFAHHIVTNIGKGEGKLKIVNNEIKMINDQPYLCVDVDNTGDLFLNPTLAMKLYDAEGQLKQTLNCQSERLYPGSVQRYLVDIKNVEDQEYTAFILLDNGDNYLFGDSFKLKATLPVKEIAKTEENPLELGNSEHTATTELLGTTENAPGVIDNPVVSSNEESKKEKSSGWSFLNFLKGNL